MDGIVQRGVNSAPYNIEVIPWREGHGVWGCCCFRAIAQVMCPCFLPPAPPEVQQAGIKFYFIDTRNNLKIRVRTGLDDTDPGAAQDLRTRLRARLTAEDGVRGVLTAAKNTEQGSERRRFLGQIINGCLQENVAPAIFEPCETVSGAMPCSGEPQHEIPSYDDLPEYTPTCEQLEDCRSCDISHEKDAFDMVFYNKHFYRYNSLVINNAHGGADPFGGETPVNWDKVYKVVPGDQIEVHDNKAFDSDERLNSELQVTRL